MLLGKGILPQAGRYSPEPGFHLSPATPFLCAGYNTDNCMEALIHLWSNHLWLGGGKQNCMDSPKQVRGEIALSPLASTSITKTALEFSTLPLSGRSCYSGAEGTLCWHIPQRNYKPLFICIKNLIKSKLIYVSLCIAKKKKRKKIPWAQSIPSNN